MRRSSRGTAHSVLPDRLGFGGGCRRSTPRPSPSTARSSARRCSTPPRRSCSRTATARSPSGALGERTGLARNSIYRYFTSRDDLIAALCERDMPRWLEELEAAMAAATDPTRASRRSSRRSCGSSPTAATGWPSCSATRRSGRPCAPASTRSPTGPRRCWSPSSGDADAAARRPARPGRGQRRRAAPARRRHARRGRAADRHARADARPLTRAVTGFAELPGPDRGADARARAGRGRAARRVRLGVRAAPRRPSVPAAAGDRAGRVAVPVDDDRAPDDALHRAAGRQHGLYEWQIYEPALDAMILPLPFVRRRRRPPLDARPARPRARPDVLRAARRAGARAAAARRSRPATYS